MSRGLEIVTRWITDGPFQRWPWLLPVLSFAVGWIGYLLVQRTENMAQGIAVIVLLAWPWLLAETTMGKLLVRLSKGRFSPKLISVITQNLQQEILFFALPFLIATTQRDLGQIAFTTLVAAGALVSTLDPIYGKRIAEHPGWSVAFHAFCTFIAGLVVLPIALQLPLERSLLVALGLSAFGLLMSLPRMLAGSETPGQRLLGVAAIVALLFALWEFRGHVPPAGLSLKGSRITQSVEDLKPGAAIKKISAETVLNEGLYAFVQIRAPTGLAQDVVFEWWQGKQRTDDIPTEILGGNEAGWRTFSRKQNFPADPVGNWHVDVRTPQGQLICRLPFKVTAAAPQASGISPTSPPQGPQAGEQEESTKPDPAGLPENPAAEAEATPEPAEPQSSEASPEPAPPAEAEPEKLP